MPVVDEIEKRDLNTRGHVDVGGLRGQQERRRRASAGG
jgi:hypothetical protein